MTAQAQGPGSIPIATLANPGSGLVIGSAAGLAAALKPPGTVLGTANNQTGTVAINSVVETSATLYLTIPNVTYDGTLCWFEFEIMFVAPPVAAVGHVSFNLWDGGGAPADLGRVARAMNPAAAAMQVTINKRWLFQPAAGTRTYDIRAWSNGNANLFAGVGGAGISTEAQFTISKA